jgi:carboxylesterase
VSDAAPKNQQDLQRLQQLSLTAWEVEQNREFEAPAGAVRNATMRSHERLNADFEKWTDVDPDKRSQVRIRPDADEAVLLIHGSTGNPGDLRGVGDLLFERGFTVTNVLLPGHGHEGDALPEVMWKACLNEVLLRYGILSRVYKKVHVVGFSFGGALAIHLAHKENPASLVLLATALNPKVGFWTRLLLNLGLHRLSFVRRSIGWNLEVFECMDKAKSLIGKLRLPIYAAHCEDDERIDASSLRYLQRKAKHRASRFRLFPQGGHMILEAHGRESLHSEIGEFLTRS